MSSTQTIEFICYPFGMVMPGRNWTAASADGHRFGFNGKESDDEIKGDGNSLDFGARIYDPRIGRFLSTDPWARRYSSITPFSFAGNNPIKLVDKEGKGPNEPPSTPKPNCIILIVSADQLQADFYNTSDMGTFHIIVATDITQATTSAKSYYGDSKIENLVIYTHGTQESKSLVTQPEEYVSPDDGEEYVTNSIGTETIAKYNVDPTNSAGNLNDKDYQDIQQLDQLFNFVNPKGTCVLAACSFGDNGTTGQQEVAKLAENKFTIYFNQDYSTVTSVDGTIQVWMGGQGMTHAENFDQGWVKIEAGSSSQPEQLKDKDEKTGNISLDSREGKKAVTEQPKLN